MQSFKEYISEEPVIQPKSAVSKSVQTSRVASDPSCLDILNGYMLLNCHVCGEGTPEWGPGMCVDPIDGFEYWGPECVCTANCFSCDIEPLCGIYKDILVRLGCMSDGGGYQPKEKPWPTEDEASSVSDLNFRPTIPSDGGHQSTA